MLSTSQFAERLAPIAPRNWSNINDEAQKLVFASWAALLSTSLVGSRARSRVMAIPNLAYASRRKASVRFGSWKPQIGAVRFISRPGRPVRFGSRDMAVRFGSVRVTWRFGSVRVV